jgi:uncharacterized membrane protein YkoI
MNRRIVLSGLSALLLFASLSTLPAFADGGDDNGGDDSGKDDGGGDDGGKDGGGDDGGHDDGGGGGGSSGSGGGSSGGSGSSGSSGSGKTGGSGGSKGSGDNGKGGDVSDALPLGQMLALFQQRGHATVLDVRLARSNQTLLYVFKYIDGTGTVRKSYFDARTGALVQ